MTPDEIKRVQVRVGVVADGEFGRESWLHLFARLGARPERAVELALGANVHVPAHEIGTPLRLAHFLAQVAHESGGFVYMEEIWGPTPAQRGYEGRTDLGNTQPGDGRRFAGRGPIQITGRRNYRYYGGLAGIDLENHPEIAAFPSIGMLTACLYWSDHGLNAWADADNIEEITRRINGGLNGLDDRRARLAQAKALLL